MRRRRFVISCLTVVALQVLVACQRSDGNPKLEIREQKLVGKELCLLIETYRTWQPFLSHASKAGDAKGYLIKIDLASAKPLAERTKVLGPLWDVPGARSALSLQAGANFTQDDVDAANATPWCGFDADGSLLRFQRDVKRKVLMRDVLDMAGEPTWKRQGDTKPIDDQLGPMSEDRLTTKSGRFVLLNRNGEATLYDAFNGEAQDDPWLTKSFSHSRAISKLNNINNYLTDDLKYLVVCPMAIWNDGKSTIETFDFAGKTYKRADVGLVYRRADEQPQLFPRKLEDGASFLAEPPHGAYSIDGELFLFMNDEHSLRLYTPDASKEMRLEAKPKPLWPLYPYLRMQHVPASGELVIFDTNEITDKAGQNETVSVIRWHYRSNEITRNDEHIRELFEERGGQFLPKSAIPVK